MTLTELRFAVAVAKEGHFGKAAKQCCVSQPTLSLGIKKLEANLGIVLFERGHHDLVITSLGKKVIIQAERALFEAQKIKHIARGDIHTQFEQINVGAIRTIGPCLYPSLLAHIEKAATSHRFKFEEYNTQDLLRRIRNGQIDLAILSLPIKDPLIESVPVYEEPFELLLPVAHPLSLKEKVDVADILHEKILLPGGDDCYREQILAILYSASLFRFKIDALHNLIENSSYETIRHMIAAGSGISILPFTLASADKTAHRLVNRRPFTKTAPTRQIGVAWRKNSAWANFADELAHAIRQCNLSGVRYLPPFTANETPMKSTFENVVTL